MKEFFRTLEQPFKADGSIARELGGVFGSHQHDFLVRSSQPDTNSPHSFLLFLSFFSRFFPVVFFPSLYGMTLHFRRDS